jgi:CBS domain containing-hemolysin-like protein
VSIKEIFTPISKVHQLYLDTKFNSETINLILSLGVSRVPIALSQNYPVIIGVLIVKTLLGVEPNEETIEHLFKNKVIKLQIPLYFK